MVHGNLGCAGWRDSMSRWIEVPMETQANLQTLQPTSELGPATISAHSRLIDDVRIRGGKRTGKVRCLEYGTTFDDPYHGLK